MSDQQAFVPSSYSYLWRAGLPDAIEDLARAGFGETEIMAALPHIDLWERGASLAREITEASERAGLRISGLNPPGLDINISSADPSMRAWSVASYIAVGRLAADVSARYLVVHPGRVPVLSPAPSDLAREWVADGVGQIVRALEPIGIQVLFENTPTGLLDTGQECVDLVRDIGEANLGLVYDVANGFMVEDPNDGLRTVAGLVRVIHLSDTTRARWLHDPIGTGEVDFATVATTVADIGFRGDIVLETVHPGVIAEGLQQDRSRLRAMGWTG